MIKEDCFAFRKEKQECNCLRELYCNQEECRFYKSREKVKEEKEKYILR